MRIEPIIDIHQHALKMRYEENGTPIINPVTGEPSTADSDDSLMEKTLEAMDQYNIVKSFICGSLKDVYRWMNVAPERFIPSPEVYADPLDPNVETVKEELLAGRIMAIGEIGTQYNGVPPNDPMLEPYFTLAEELDAPVCIHACGGGAFMPTFRVSAGNPLLLEDVLVNHPRLRLWIAHAGYPFLAETISILSQYPRVYADVSAINWLVKREAFHDYLQSLVRSSYDVHPSVKRGVIYGEPIVKRLMFGSDQMTWPETIGMAIKAVESADFLSEEQKRDIFYNNAKRFLRL
ncbi:MAG: amidohydrolase family protein [Candidatus Thorarchaeota archaeon]|jgi:predicted TIM-barrel fold metal-dependent hydrolase